MGKQLFDQYTLLHFAVGIVAYFWNISLLNTFILHTLFELLENTTLGMKIINKFYFWPGGKPYADSFINSIGDTIAVIMGWYLAYILDHLGSKKGWYDSHLTS